MIRLAITQGEPAGAGLDILSLLAAKGALPSGCEWVYLGSRDALLGRAEMLGLQLRAHDFDPAQPGEGLALRDLGGLPGELVPGRPQPGHQAGVLQALDLAADGCLGGDFAAMVTLPVQKSAIHEAGAGGAGFRGQTEYLAQRCGEAEALMVLDSPQLRVALVTTHLPLAQVPAAVTEQSVGHALRLLDGALRQRWGLERPRIGVLGLNPHAGEGGWLGSEERERIEPAMAAAGAEGVLCEGPLAADTAFVPARAARYDALLCMYHDQGLAALKQLAFAEAVNVTCGLPLVRTSPDHGTALDLAGSGSADTASTLRAMQLALAHGTRGA